jgi:hypothetical protein
MRKLTLLETYIKERMTSFERWEEHGLSIFSWVNKLTYDQTLDELPSGFVPVPGVQFNGAALWASFDDTTIIGWRKLPKAGQNLVTVYRFSDQPTFSQELHTIMVNPESWLHLGEKL